MNDGARSAAAGREKPMLSDRSFLRLAATGAGLAVGLSFGLAVTVVSAAELPRPPAIDAASDAPVCVAEFAPSRPSGARLPVDGLRHSA